MTPPDCDLRGLKFMPLDVQMVRDSSLTAKAPTEAFRAAVILWCAAWQQVPAASLPDDDEELAHLCGYGFAQKEWKKIRTWALHKFVKCSDGRLYHPVIAEKAIEAGGRRGEWNEKNDTRAERQKRWRARQKELSELLRERGVTPPKGASLETLERLLGDAHVDSDVDAKPSTCPSTVDTGEMRKTGTGTGTIPPTPVKAPSTPPITDRLHRVMEEGRFTSPPNDGKLIDEWLAAGADFDRDVIPIVRTVSQRMIDAGRGPFKLKAFDAAIREKLANDDAEVQRLNRTAERLRRDAAAQAAADAAQAADEARWAQQAGGR
ncbi:DUF1376 domain-containing protein [Sphingomonas sp. Root1294]|uniref:DUF1376 domain-containing protein n=1 Tax=Sphingomonas sp. Root1294 TaxID=1736447 RepID=UPI001F1930B4|nr:DUF1376 domain-containing protein [Sphingomonas sp. Root1294]